MRKATIWICAALAGWCWLVTPTARAAGNGDISSDSFNRLLREAAFALLKEGNARYASGRMQHPNLDVERRQNTVSEGQQPFATILACSDSRDPVELIFDRGVGDVFVVRVAGNIAGPSELATIEYGVGHLHTPLLVVMGHSKCGAVTAVAEGAELHGHLPLLAAKIRPAVLKVKTQAGNADELVPKAIEANIWQTIGDILTQSDEIRETVARGKLQIVGAHFDLESGLVKWLGPHPEQNKLLAAPTKAVEPHETATPILALTNAPVAAHTNRPVALPRYNPDPGLSLDFPTQNVKPTSKKQSGR